MVRKVSLWVGVVLSLAYAAACVEVTCQRPGHAITLRAGQVLVYGRVRCFHDGIEFFPWRPALLPDSAWRSIERHLWLLRLGERAVSPELHPDADGSLAIWLGSGDYAIVGSTEIPTNGPSGFEVVGLIRVPEGPLAAYSGDLALRTESHEGWYASRGALGEASVSLLPVEKARALLEQRFGALPGPPVLAPWCVGEQLPRFEDPELASRGREILDRGCSE